MLGKYIGDYVNTHVLIDEPLFTLLIKRFTKYHIEACIDGSIHLHFELGSVIAKIKKGTKTRWWNTAIRNHIVGGNRLNDK